MVALKNIAFAASCVASALAAPAISKRQDWSQGGQMGSWGGEGQGQAQGGWDQSQGQAAGAATGSTTGSGDAASVPIAGDGQSSGTATGAATGSSSAASVPIAGDGQSSGTATGAATGSSSAASVPIAGDGQSSTDAAAGTDSTAGAAGAADASAGSSATGNTELAAASGETLTTSTTGTSGDYYYSHWIENNSGASMTVGDGTYSLEWTEASGNIVSGMGWNPASAKTVTYEANVQATGNWYLALYGWTKSPLIEFYVVEAFGSYDPSSGASSIGTAEIDGGTYTLLQTTRENQPSIEGTSTFQQYWAVRTEHRQGGSIDFAAHIEAWSGAGLELGSFDYMIMATEGYQSSGSSTVTVS